MGGPEQVDALRLYGDVFDHCEPEPMSGCWIWTGAQQSRGYGRYSRRRGGVFVFGMAHRVVYETLVGPIPEGMVLDHRCRNTTCVNPDHMRICTQGDNVRASRPDTAPCGHPYDMKHKGDGRRCRACRRAYWNAKFGARRKAKRVLAALR